MCILTFVECDKRFFIGLKNTFFSKKNHHKFGIIKNVRIFAV